MLTVAGFALMLGVPSSPGVASDTFEVAGFGFVAPPSWERLPAASAMRKAQFRVANPGADHDGIVIFYQFPPGMGGSAERNIERWHGQFKEAKEALGATVVSRERGSRRLHYFHAIGTLIGSDGEMPGYSLHAVVLDAPSGRAFVRFVAPAAVARANEAAFRAMIDRAFGD